ncbi:MAG: hypothetical protein A3D34_00375 [Candidatus Staskawiczbacteria bacterium RIFCSPHIGHO2_02_FULL_33_16]|uniref:Uncharacterized protein n=1 Tax=Candidatus Staskawiczbacteria bacterium RIFCSPHIGHO2_02_FULL_33_16 TaxID=1802204 RepID=A0A1G2HZI8_9BACT|nr:MAG: hypothetical protein A3D34_00375 [Candidatus Staskawiczbacteria bacterium RIFCSPHIGHO2_02_FULL_33_16]
MNKKLIIFSTITLLLLPLVIFAIIIPAQPGQGAINILSLINNLLQVLWWIFLGIIVAMSIWAGILFLTARGSEDQLGKAKKFVVWIIVGIFVAILGYGAYATIQGIIPAVVP